MPPDLADPLVLDVVERDGVGDVEAEEEDVGVVEGQRAHRVVGRRPCKAGDSEWTSRSYDSSHELAKSPFLGEIERLELFWR